MVLNRLTLRTAAWWGTLVLGAALLLPATSARGQEASQGEERRARVELIVPSESVRPGQTVPVGVKFTMRPGWHIYWTNPGDSGQAPRFSWNLPGGGASGVMRGGEWEASEPQFPTPISWSDPGGLVGYGYSGEVIFPATLTVPARTTPGQEAEVTIAVDYLICSDVCLPEQATASVVLRVSPDVGEADREAESALEKAQAAIPQDEASAAVSATDDGLEITVPMPSGAKKVEFFPEPPEGLAVEDVEVRHEGREATVSLRLRTMAGAKVTAGTFPAVVGFDTPQGRRGLRVQVPVDGDRGD